MTEEELERLVFRRGLVIGNIEALKERARLAANTLHSLNDRIAGLENAYEFINTELMNHYHSGILPNVEVIKVFDERDKEKYMLKINIDNSGSSIYKILHNLDLALYTNSDEIIDKMAFKFRCQELASDYLKSHHNISSAINNMADYLDEVLPRFIHSPRIEKQLERQISNRVQF